MKCAGCDTMHLGIQGLLPVKFPRPMGYPFEQKIRMLCQVCIKKRNAQKADYEKASRGE